MSFEKHLCPDKESVIKLYGACTVARKLDGWSEKIVLLGDPLSSSFHKEKIVTVKVPGNWDDGKTEQLIQIHKDLTHLYMAVFQEIGNLKLGYQLTYSGGFAFRYNTSQIKHLKDRPEYSGLGEDKRFTFVEMDRKSGAFDQIVTWKDKKKKEHSASKKSLLSNHTFGSAIDLNYSSNPMGSEYQFDMPKQIVEVFAKYGFAWGGYYHDYTHFEYMLDHILGSANIPVAPPEATSKKTSPQEKVAPKPAPASPQQKSSAPAPAAAPSSLIAGLQFSKDWLEQEWQQYQDKKREEEVEEAHDAIQSDSGYFPIGLNLTWHGGIHCRASKDGSVHAMTDGIVVAVRLPDKDPAKLSYGSRNFVLVKHKTRQGKPFWSLYMHLRPVLLKSDDQNLAEVFPWLLKRTLTRVGEGTTNFRSSPDAEHGEVIRELDPKETFDVSDERLVGSQRWLFVRATKDDSTGWVALTSKFSLKSEITGLEDIKAGKVMKLSAPVKRGDCLGFISPAPAGKNPFLHWEVFSSELVSEQWLQVKDEDNDIVCDSEAFKKLLNKSQAVTFLDPLTKDNIRTAYGDEKTTSQIRKRAFFFKSEWSVDWNTALDKLKKDFDVKDLAPRLQLYNFWKDAEALGCDLPKGGKAWHYHPTEFITREFPVPKAAPPDTVAGNISLTEAQTIALRVTTVFEGGELRYSNLAGNFDGAGISWGIIQWNIGTNSLQILLKKMREIDPAAFKSCFSSSQFSGISDVLDKFDYAHQMNWAKGTHSVVQKKNSKGHAYTSFAWNDDWDSAFSKLAAVEKFQKIQVESAINKYHPVAWAAIQVQKSLFPVLFDKIYLWSYCATFDLAIQQGGIGNAAAIAAYKSEAASKICDSQATAMEFLFRYKADRAKKAFRADCFSRRMGVLTAQAYQAQLAGATATRENKNYELLVQTGNRPIQES